MLEQLPNIPSLIKVLIASINLKEFKPNSVLLSPGLPLPERTQSTAWGHGGGQWAFGGRVQGLLLFSQKPSKRV